MDVSPYAGVWARSLHDGKRLDVIDDLGQTDRCQRSRGEEGIVGRGQLSEGDVNRLAAALESRLGTRSDGKRLAVAYLNAVQWQALERAVGSGPPVTALGSYRIDLLMHVSKELGRLITDEEVGALMRVTPATARRWHRELLAVYADEANPLALAWSLEEARRLGRGDEADVVGEKIGFPSADCRDVFVEQLERLGHPVVVLHGERTQPWVALAGDEFSVDQFLPNKAKRR